MKIGKILFPTDFSDCADQAFSYALFFTREFQSELHMLHSIDLDRKPYKYISSQIPDVEKIFPALTSEFGKKMDTLIQNEKAGDLNIKKANVTGKNSPETILNYCEANNIDLIVMGTHGRRGLGYSVLGSVAAEVVRNASCPVLTIREKKDEKPFVDEGHILVPFDFSEHSTTALKYAREIAIKYNARLDIIHIVEETCYPKVYGIAKRIDNVIKDKAHAELERIGQETIGQDVKYFIHTVTGNAPLEILNFAEKNQNELIVISTHGCTGLKHFFFGSVAEKVIQRAPCPVFTLKAFGKSLI